MAKSKQDRYEQIKRFESDLSQCMKCGFCSFWCPVYQEERIEPSVARGKNMMIRALVAGGVSHETISKEIPFVGTLLKKETDFDYFTNYMRRHSR